MIKIKRFFDSKYSFRTLFGWLMGVLKDNWIQSLANALTGIIGVGLSLSAVWAVKHAIDVASGYIEGSVYWSVALMAGIILCDFGLSITKIWIRNTLGIRARNRMQQKMLDHILSSHIEGKDKFHSGDVINRLENDVREVVNFLTETIPEALSTALLFIGAFTYLFNMDPALAFITIGIIPVFMLLSKLYMNKMHRLTRKMKNSESRVQSILQETVQHRTLIKTLEGNDTVLNRVSSTQNELRNDVINKTKFSVISNFIMNFGFASGYIVAFLWSALRMSAGTLTFGGMTAFLQLVNKIQGPARSLSSLIPQFVTVFTSAERLIELEDNPMEDGRMPIRMKGTTGIRFTNVSYSYPASEKKVLDNFSFDFTPGSSTAIVGETGIGKTTMIKLILSLLTPDSGKLEIYTDSETKDISSRMRCNFVYVPQGNNLLSGTIRDNLRLGKVDATDEEIKHVLTMACAEFVYKLPDGLDTICGERGTGLSEGQSQRIATARALLRNRRVLILDEVTSALDPETEKRVLDNLLNDRSRTVLMITHKPEVAERCDRVLRLREMQNNQQA